jgi:hypothetical protein
LTFADVIEPLGVGCGLLGPLGVLGLLGLDGLLTGLAVTPHPVKSENAEAAPNPYRTSRLVSLGFNRFSPDIQRMKFVHQEKKHSSL